VDYSEHLKSARYYLEEARKLLERGDPYDAAEKTWAAVKHATMALTMTTLNETAHHQRVSPGEHSLKTPLSRQDLVRKRRPDGLRTILTLGVSCMVTASMD